MIVRAIVLATAVASASSAHAAGERQSLDDAWWTGPMLAAGAGALPKGRTLVEPYLFDVRSKGGDTLGSLTYVLYGLADKTTVGVIPTFYVNRPDGAPNGSLQIGDLTLQAQRQMSEFKPGGWIPTSSIVVQQVLPTGKFDRLDRVADGVGGGAYATSLGYNMQTYAWLPNGRIARFRLNTTGMVSGKAKVRDRSVYGTADGFHGRAKPGATLVVNGAVEYSATRNWVLAMDVVYTHAEPTKILGVDGAGGLVRFDTGTHDSVAVAPAVEYNFTPQVGALFGMRVIPAINGRRGSVTPAVALNMVY